MTVRVIVPTVIDVPRCPAALGNLQCTLPTGHAYGHIYVSAGGDIGDEQPGGQQ